MLWSPLGFPLRLSRLFYTAIIGAEVHNKAQERARKEENKKMKKLNARKFLSIIILIAMIVSLFPLTHTAPVSADEELPIVVNDPDFDPTVNQSLIDIPWEIVPDPDTSTFDWAFTQDRSDLLGNGTSDRIQFLDENRIRFFGYDSIAHLDHLYYEETDSAEKQISFEVEQNQIDWHTIAGFGFFVNMVRHADGTVSGYALSIEESAITLRMLDHFDIRAAQNPGGLGGPFGGNFAHLSWPTIRTHPVSTGTGDRYEVNITAEETKFAIDIQHIRPNGDVEDIHFSIDLETAELSEIPSADYTGGNDFGLFSAYGSHGCSQLSFTTFSNVQIITRTVLPHGEVNVNFIDIDTIDDAVPTTIRDTYVKDGFIGQSFTVNPPARIGDYVFVESIEELTGVYGEELTTINLLYAIPEPITEPTTVPAETVIPTEPPTTEPIEPTTEPIEPTTEPIEPTTEPIEPTTEPIEPTTEPIEPTTEPIEPTTEPIEPTTEPTEPTTEPTEPTTEPTEPTTEPTEPTTVPPTCPTCPPGAPAPCPPTCPTCPPGAPCPSTPPSSQPSSSQSSSSQPLGPSSSQPPAPGSPPLPQAGANSLNHMALGAAFLTGSSIFIYTKKKKSNK